MSMRRLHAPTYERLMQTTTQELYRCGGPTGAAAVMALQAKMQGDLATLIGHGPEMSLDRLAVESGGLAGELSYTFGTEGADAPGGSGAADAASAAGAAASEPLPAIMMARAYVRGAFRLPVVWVRKLSQATATKLPGRAPDPSTVDVMLDQAQAQGYLVRDGDYVKGEASYAKGALTVNGKPFGPPAPR